MNAVKIIMKNEGCSEQEAEQIWDDCRHDVREYIMNGDYEGAEDCILGYGLDLDFLMNCL